MTSRLANKRLYIADLADRLRMLETGLAPMHALAYRVLARRLHEAAAGFAPGCLAGTFGIANAQVAEMLENRHFDAHGVLIADPAAACQHQARALFARLGVRQPALAWQPPGG